MSNSRQASDGVFDLDALIADADNKPFKFTFAGREWTLPHLSDLDAWPLIAAMEQGDSTAARSTMALAVGDEWDEFRSHRMPQHALNSLFERYTAHSGMAPGKQPASSSS